MIALGEDMNGNQIFPGDRVIRNGNIEETIEHGKFREKFDGGYVVGYYVPDYCIKIIESNKEEI